MGTLWRGTERWARSPEWVAHNLVGIGLRRLGLGIAAVPPTPYDATHPKVRIRAEAPMWIGTIPQESGLGRYRKKCERMSTMVGQGDGLREHMCVKRPTMFLAARARGGAKHDVLKISAVAMQRSAGVHTIPRMCTRMPNMLRNATQTNFEDSGRSGRVPAAWLRTQCFGLEGTGSIDARPRLSSSRFPT